MHILCIDSNSCCICCCLLNSLLLLGKSQQLTKPAIVMHHYQHYAAPRARLCRWLMNALPVPSNWGIAHHLKEQTVYHSAYLGFLSFLMAVNLGKNSDISNTRRTLMQCVHQWVILRLQILCTGYYLKLHHLNINSKWEYSRMPL